MSDHRRTHQDPANAALGLTAIAAVDNHDEDCFRLGTKVISGQDYRMITSDERSATSRLGQEQESGACLRLVP
jgi:hypothetical protein